MRAHEWKTLEGLYKLAQRFTIVLERIADHLEGKSVEEVAKELSVEEKPKVKRGRKSKETKVEEPTETKDSAA